MSDKIEATLAFVFNENLDQVLLIKKQKPPQHAGLLNGLGGKLEAGETHLGCVTREISEEAGLSIPPQKWLSVGQMTWSNWEVSIWTATTTDNNAKAFPESGVAWYPVQILPKNIIANLAWLIPLAVDVVVKAESQDEMPQVKIEYTTTNNIP